MKPSVLLLCVLGAVLASAFCSNANGPTVCCFEVYPRRIAQDRIQSYTLTDERCSKAGVLFLTQKNRTICVDLNMGWVQSIMKRLDEKSF